MKPQPAVAARDSFELGPWIFRPDRNLIEGAEVARPITPKAMDLICLLYERRGDVVSKQEIVDRVWSGDFISDGLVSHAVYELRRALSDDFRAPRYIETIPKRGYRLLPAEQPRRPQLEPVAQFPPPRNAGSRLTVTLLAALLLAAGAFAIARTKIESGKTARSVDTLEPVIAIQTFENISGAPEDDYLAVGTTLALTDTLQRIESFRVLPSSAGKDTTHRSRFLLQGSVRRVGPNEIELKTQLIDGQKDAPIWSLERQHQVRHAQQVNREIAIEVARQIGLQGQLAGNTPAAREADSAAWELYLEGRYRLDRSGAENTKLAIEKLEAAAAQDSALAPAQAALAKAHVLAGMYYGEPFPRIYPKARQAAERALTLDPGLGAAHAALAAVVAGYEWRFADAEAAYERAIELSPYDADSFAWYAVFLSTMARHEEARVHIERAQELKPASLLVAYEHAYILLFSGDSEAAARQFQEAIALRPDHLPSQLGLGLAYERAGRSGEAHEQYADALERAQLPAGDLEAYRAAYAESGLDGTRRWWLDRLVSSPERAQRRPLQLASAYAELGNRDQAFEHLEKAVTQRDYLLLWLKVGFAWDGIRSDPRFQTTLDQIGFPRGPVAG